MDNSPYSCDSSVVENFEEVVPKDSSIVALDDIVLDVESCLSIVNWPKSCRKELMGTWKWVWSNGAVKWGVWE